jgi:hypothetical protein
MVADRPTIGIDLRPSSIRSTGAQEIIAHRSTIWGGTVCSLNGRPPLSPLTIEHLLSHAIRRTSATVG